MYMYTYILIYIYTCIHGIHRGGNNPTCLGQTVFLFNCPLLVALALALALALAFPLAHALSFLLATFVICSLWLYDGVSLSK